MKPVTIPCIIEKCRRGEKIVMLTAYDATFARLADESGIDMILVGDSLGMVIQGHENTLPVTLEDVVYHASCVSRAAKGALVVADLPFMSYQSSRSQALLSAGRAMKEGGARAVKLEGGMEMAETCKLMVAAGIPAMAHIGLKPQRVHQMGGYKIQGRTADEARELVNEARAFEDAGAFSIVLEGVAIETAQEITESVSIPTIGISSGPHCGGQVLVIYDLLGLNPEFHPTYLKVYADGHKFVTDAIRKYAKEVKEGKFPAEAHGFHAAPRGPT